MPCAVFLFFSLQPAVSDGLHNDNSIIQKDGKRVGRRREEGKKRRKDQLSLEDRILLLLTISGRGCIYPNITSKTEAECSYQSVLFCKEFERDLEGILVGLVLCEPCEEDPILSERRVVPTRKELLK